MEPHRSPDDLPVIVLATQPRIFREVLHRALENASDLPLVLEADNWRRLSQILSSVATRWLFITASKNSFQYVDVAELLRRYPSLSIASISLHRAIIDVFEVKDDNRVRQSRHENLSLGDVLAMVDNSCTTRMVRESDPVQH